MDISVTKVEYEAPLESADGIATSHIQRDDPNVTSHIQRDDLNVTSHIQRDHSQKENGKGPPRRRYKVLSKGAHASASAPDIRSSLSILKLPQNLDKVEFLERLVTQLKEDNVELFERIVDAATLPMSRSILDETMEIERNGGEIVGGGKNRRRTAGGIFISILKKRLSGDVIKNIWKDQDLQQRRRKQATKKMSELDRELKMTLETHPKQRKRNFSDISIGLGDVHPQIERDRQPKTPKRGKRRCDAFDWDASASASAGVGVGVGVGVDSSASSSNVESYTPRLSNAVDYSDIA